MKWTYWVHWWVLGKENFWKSYLGLHKMQILLQANEAGNAQQTVWVKCTTATRSKQIRQLSSDLILGSLEIKYEITLFRGVFKKRCDKCQSCLCPHPLCLTKKKPKMHFYRIHFEVLLAIHVSFSHLKLQNT